MPRRACLNSPTPTPASPAWANTNHTGWCWNPRRGHPSGIPGARFPSSHRVADPAAAYLIADILSDNNARALAFGMRNPAAVRLSRCLQDRHQLRLPGQLGFRLHAGVHCWRLGRELRRLANETVSGVTGAAPLLHDLVEHLHEHYGTTWYSAPANVIECWIHPVTGKRLDLSDAGRIPDAVREKFLATNLPPVASTTDYDDTGTHRQPVVRLGNEYLDWFASSDNWLGDRAVLATTPGALRILFPLPGTVVYLDPDLPQQGRRVFLRAEGPETLQWQSDSLQIARDGSRQVALLTEGRHRITVRDVLTGAQAQTWLEVLAR